ncbi:hypothetical protein [Mucilaginibacter sp.]|uniref:hypothetical protein n=1 Tax=Mucilaginibacter sp. TaxID=1882438 RepID=UPI003D0F9637
MIIKVKDPDSSQILQLDVKPVDNIPEPGWSVTLKDNECVLINLKNGTWEAHPADIISVEFTQAIGYQINPSTVPGSEAKAVADQAPKERRTRL